MHERKTSHPGQGLVVRRHDRFEVAFGADVAVTPEQAAAIRLSPAAGGRSGILSAEVSDISGGGMALKTNVFLPRGALLTVRLKNPTGGPEPLLDARARVQRVTMIDRRPVYLLGLSFADQSERFRAQFEALLARLDSLASGSAKGAAPC